MLKAHQACIDLEKNVLRIQGREVKFLSEHELPAKARDPLEPSELPTATPASQGNFSGGGRNPASSSFSGEGRTLGAAPASSAPPRAAAPAAASASRSTHPEDKIRLLLDLGATRELAISTLDAAGGNVDVAASLLF